MVGSIGSIQNNWYYQYLNSVSESSSDTSDFTSSQALQTLAATTSDDTEQSAQTGLETLTLGEHQQMMQSRSPGVQPPPPPPQPTADDIVAAVDTNGDNAISKDEYQALVNSSGESNAASTDNIFSALDTNGDGEVTTSELETAQKNSGPPPMPPMGPPPGGTGKTESKSDSSNSSNSSDTAGTDSEMDINGDGVVSIEEYLAYYASKQLDASSTGDANSAGSENGNTNKNDYQQSITELDSMLSQNNQYAKEWSGRFILNAINAYAQGSIVSGTGNSQLDNAV